MISLEYQICIAFFLDLLIGDPRWFPHPVKLVGKLAVALEKIFRKLVPSSKAAGFLSVFFVLIITGVVTKALLLVAATLHPLAETAVSIFILYTTIAARDPIKHSNDVYHALKNNDIAAARRLVGYIVGRDTDRLDEEGIAKAAVESVAESMVDGVTAPLFFAFLGGPVGAMLYKAVNTLDSTFGYKNEQYKKFGWTAARLDDLVNFIPARMTSILVPLAALFTGLNFKNSLKILLRDRLNHASPNSAHTEAAVAGALDIQLGGSNYYFGKLIEKPTIGDPTNKICFKHIRKTNLLMLFTSIFTLVIFTTTFFLLRLN